MTKHRFALHLIRESFWPGFSHLVDLFPLSRGSASLLWTVALSRLLARVAVFSPCRRPRDLGALCPILLLVFVELVSIWLW